MNCHVIGVPYAKVTKEMVWDAFTYKQYKFMKMMYGKPDMKFIYYGHEDSEVDCDEFVPCIDDEVLINSYGKVDSSYYWRGNHIDDYAHLTMNKNASKHILNNWSNGDMILNFWQVAGMSLYEKYGLPYENMVDVGHGSEILPISKYVSYESYWLYAYLWGKKQANENLTPAIRDVEYHAITPLMTEMNDFTFQKEKGDYYLFFSRVIPLKGIGIVMLLSELEPDKKFIIAGYKGGTEDHLMYYDYNGVRYGFDDVIKRDNVEYLGGVYDPKIKNELYMNAKALLMCSAYGEPFGGTVTEAHACGTPVISVDWGAFKENNPHGFTGLHCRTMSDWRVALERIDEIRPENCRKFAEDNYSLEVVSCIYENYLRRCYDWINGKGDIDKETSYRLLNHRNIQGCQYI